MPEYSEIEQGLYLAAMIFIIVCLALITLAAVLDALWRDFNSSITKYFDSFCDTYERDWF